VLQALSAKGTSVRGRLSSLGAGAVSYWLPKSSAMGRNDSCCLQALELVDCSHPDHVTDFISNVQGLRRRWFTIREPGRQ